MCPPVSEDFLPLHSQMVSASCSPLHLVTKTAWQKPHRMNMTGTPEAYRPAGSILAKGRRPKATGDYKAWKPR